MNKIKIGFAVDIHRLETGTGFVLGGVRLPSDRKTVAHSDGDCLYHAVAEAILGALALGDLGTFFPPSDPNTIGLDSSVILKFAVNQAKVRGYAIGNIDCSVVLEQPKLRPYIENMCSNMAEILEVGVEDVSIKAGTNEGVDEVGRNLAVQCFAAVLLVQR